MLGVVASLSVTDTPVATVDGDSFSLELRTYHGTGSGDALIRYNTKRKGYNKGDERVRNIFGRRRSGRSRTVGGGTGRRGRSVFGGTSSGTVELAIGALVIVVLVVVLLRLLGML